MMELLRDLLVLPPGASTIADEIDVFHAIVIGVAMLGAVVVALMALDYLRRYRAHGRDLTAPVPEWRMPTWLEVTLIGGVSVLFLGWWLVGVRQYDRLRDPPRDSLRIYVVAKQWMFKFAYPDGRTTADVLYVPAGHPVTLVMTSRDVIHSFFVPAFRVKYDVLPDRYTMMWFQAPTPGEYPLLCAEYCGTGHSTMGGVVRVLDPEDYEAWLAGAQLPDADPSLDPPASNEIRPRPRVHPELLAERGEEVAARRGCLRCHTTDGSPHIGPSFAGLHGATIPLQDGGEIVADEAYLTESMMDPLAHVHAGFTPVMPSYKGMLEPAEVAALLELIESLRAPVPARAYPPPQAQGTPAYPVPEGSTP